LKNRRARSLVPTNSLVPTDLAVDKVSVSCRYFRSTCLRSESKRYCFSNSRSVSSLNGFEVSKSGEGFGVETVDAESTDHAAPARVHRWISLISSSFDNGLNLGGFVDLKIIGWAQRRSS
jgi:hypothetical protein